MSDILSTTITDKTVQILAIGRPILLTTLNYPSTTIDSNVEISISGTSVVVVRVVDYHLPSTFTECKEYINIKPSIPAFRVLSYSKRVTCENVTIQVPFYTHVKMAVNIEPVDTPGTWRGIVFQFTSKFVMYRMVQNKRIQLLSTHCHK